MLSQDISRGGGGQDHLEKAGRSRTTGSQFCHLLQSDAHGIVQKYQSTNQVFVVFRGYQQGKQSRIFGYTRKDAGPGSTEGMDNLVARREGRDYIGG